MSICVYRYICTHPCIALKNPVNRCRCCSVTHRPAEFRSGESFEEFVDPCIGDLALLSRRELEVVVVVIMVVVAVVMVVVLQAVEKSGVRLV